MKKIAEHIAGLNGLQIVSSLGTGANGEAFQSNNPDIVYKVTLDREEYRIGRFLVENPTRGMNRVYNTWEVEGLYGDIYVLEQDRVDTNIQEELRMLERKTLVDQKVRECVAGYYDLSVLEEEVSGLLPSISKRESDLAWQYIELASAHIRIGLSYCDVFFLNIGEKDGKLVNIDITGDFGEACMTGTVNRIRI